MRSVSRLFRWTIGGGGAVAEPDRWSVWEQLRGDPGAAALRAEWESRWDEF